jgi:hypothetical protein
LGLKSLQESPCACRARATVSRARLALFFSTARAFRRALLATTLTTCATSARGVTPTVGSARARAATSVSRALGFVTRACALQAAQSQRTLLTVTATTRQWCKRISSAWTAHPSATVRARDRVTASAPQGAAACNSVTRACHSAPLGTSTTWACARRATASALRVVLAATRLQTAALVGVDTLCTCRRRQAHASAWSNANRGCTPTAHQWSASIATSSAGRLGARALRHLNATLASTTMTREPARASLYARSGHTLLGVTACPAIPTAARALALVRLRA